MLFPETMGNHHLEEPSSRRNLQEKLSIPNLEPSIKPAEVDGDLHRLILLSWAEGELISPIAHLEVSVEVEMLGSTPWFMNARKLQRYTLRVVDQEGTHLSMSLRWWTKSFILTSLLGLLSFAALVTFYLAGSNGHVWYVLVGSLLILMWHIAVFSMAAMVLKVGWFGVVRLLRLSWLRRLRRQRTKASSGDTVSRTDIRRLRSERSSQSFKVG